MAIDNSTKFGIVKTTKDKITTSSMNEGKLYVALDDSLGGGYI